MAPVPITETRLIYTQGVYVLSEAMRSCRQIAIYVDLLRFPKFTVYANDKSNPPYYFLGYYTVWKGDYVENRQPLEFTEQAVFSYDNPVLQLGNLLLAAATNITDTIQALGGAMTPPAVIVFIPQPPASGEGCPYTRLKFKMPLGTRIQVTAIGIPLESYGGAQTVEPSLHEPNDEVPRYPLDRDPSQDPSRSPPYDDELPGDTAIATSEDPDSGLIPVVCTLTFEVRRSDLPAFVDYASAVVPDDTYDNVYIDITSTAGSTYTYRGLSSGSMGVILVYAGGSPADSTTITFSNPAVNCV